MGSTPSAPGNYPLSGIVLSVAKAGVRPLKGSDTAF